MKPFDKNSDPLADPQALQEHIDQALAVEMPGGLDIELNYQMIKRIFRPMVLRAENIPDEPCLFVGNHSLFALDGAVLAPLFFRELRRFPRSMGDKFLFAYPPLARLLMKNGTVMGHPEVCTALMQDGQDLLVFPGGAHEAVKPSSELYELQWKERYGFVRLAARNGYTIMPFGLVGPDEFYGHYMEGQELPNSLLGRLLARAGILDEDVRTDILPPIPVGSLGTPFPKPQRCYLGFGDPIRLGRYRNKSPGKQTLQTIRARVAEQIEMQLTELLFTREQQRGKDSLLRRLLTL
jgi:1-acyl-sn-glycerol-3-phosphate acyltransferase